MLSYLSSVACELMPGAKKNQMGEDMVEYRRGDNQFVLLTVRFGAQKTPVVIASILEEAGARLGVADGSSQMLVGGKEVPVCVRYLKYQDRPAKLLVTFDAKEETTAEDVLRWVVRAM